MRRADDCFREVLPAVWVSVSELENSTMRQSGPQLDCTPPKNWQWCNYDTPTYACSTQYWTIHKPHLFSLTQYRVILVNYGGADKSLTRPGRKQANVSVRMAWISFGVLTCREKNLMTAHVSMLLKSRASLTCFQACFLPGRAKDLSA